MMKIALYHNQMIHYEILGYMVEYCLNNNYDVDIYTIYTDDYSKTWIQWYNNLYENKINWIESLKIKEEIEYDVIVLVSDDNYNFEYVDEKYYHKMICIDHWYLNRNPKLKYHIGLRKVFSRNMLPYTIPCYNIISEEDKREIVEKDNKIKVIFLGRFNIPNSLTFLLFDKIDSIEFHIVRRKEGEPYFGYLKDMPNVYFHYNLETNELMDLMKKSHYVFLMPVYIEGYQQHKLSSIIPLAYSTLCQCIIPNSWNQHLKLKSVIEYDDLKYLTPDRQIDLDINQFKSSLNEISKEREDLINQNKEVLDCGVDYIINKNGINNLSSLSISCQRVGIERPKIYIETTINSYFNISKIFYEYDEIHSIQFNYNTNTINLVKNYSHINMYYDSNINYLSQLCKNIQEPIFFYLDTYNFVDILVQLKKIGKRKFNDYIIINDISKWINKYTINNIIKSYNKKCKTINVTDIDWLIVLSSYD